MKGTQECSVLFFQLLMNLKENLVVFINIRKLLGRKLPERERKQYL